MRLVLGMELAQLAMQTHMVRRRSLLASDRGPLLMRGTRTIARRQATVRRAQDSKT